MHLNMEFRRRLFSRNRLKRHIFRPGMILTAESGQGLLEMALLTPMLLLLALGVIELGRLAIQHRGRQCRARRRSVWFAEPGRCFRQRGHHIRHAI